jgi:hypothetical protein
MLMTEKPNLQFKTKTEGDKTRVYEIDTRLENAAPPDTNSMLQKLRVEAEQWAEAIKEEAKKEKESTPTAMSALCLSYVLFHPALGRSNKS